MAAASGGKPDSDHHIHNHDNHPNISRCTLPTSESKIESLQKSLLSSSLENEQQSLQRTATSTPATFPLHGELEMIALSQTKVQQLEPLDLDEYGVSYSCSPPQLTPAKKQSNIVVPSNKVIPAMAYDGGHQGFIHHPNTIKTQLESLKLDNRSRSYGDQKLSSVTAHSENISDFLVNEAAPETANDKDNQTINYFLKNGASPAMAKGNSHLGSVLLPLTNSLPLKSADSEEREGSDGNSPPHPSAGKIQDTVPTRGQTLSYISALLNQKTQAPSTSPEKSGSMPNAIPLRPVQMINGRLTISFTKEEIGIMAIQFKWALVGKFPSGRPLIDRIRGSFAKLHIKGNHRISLLDRKHVLIELSCEEDHLRIWSSRGWTVDGKLMRIFRWSTNFRGNEESPIVPLWISFPFLPCHLARCRTALFSLAGAVGKPIRADPATLVGSRPTVARVSVEVDVSKTIPKCIWIDSEDSPFAQEIITDKVPKFCSECRLLGHSNKECYVSQPEKRKENKKKKQIEHPKTATDPAKKTIGPLIEIEETETCARFNDTVMAAIETVVAENPVTNSHGTIDHEIPTLVLDTPMEHKTILGTTEAHSATPEQFITDSSSSTYTSTSMVPCTEQPSPTKNLICTPNRKPSPISPPSPPSPPSTSLTPSSPSTVTLKQRMKCPSEPDQSVGDPEDKIIIGYTHSDPELHPRLQKRYPKIGPNRFELPTRNFEEEIVSSSEDTDEDSSYQADLEEERKNKKCFPQSKWKKGRLNPQGALDALQVVVDSLITFLG